MDAKTVPLVDGRGLDAMCILVEDVQISYLANNSSHSQESEIDDVNFTKLAENCANIDQYTGKSRKEEFSKFEAQKDGIDLQCCIFNSRKRKNYSNGLDASDSGSAVDAANFETGNTVADLSGQCIELPLDKYFYRLGAVCRMPLMKYSVCPRECLWLS